MFHRTVKHRTNHIFIIVLYAEKEEEERRERERQRERGIIYDHLVMYSYVKRK